MLALYAQGTGFNLSILECKSCSRALCVGVAVVLIYPYWNVNDEKEERAWMEHIVLIYPYWNVNTAHGGEIISKEEF